MTPEQEKQAKACRAEFVADYPNPNDAFNDAPHDVYFKGWEARGRASGQQGDETAWLVENGIGQYLYMGPDGMFVFGDLERALRFSRRCDAEQIARECDDAVRVAEHMWHSLAASPQTTPPALPEFSMGDPHPCDVSAAQPSDSVQGWISVKDRLPMYMVSVIATDGNCVKAGYRTDGSQWSSMVNVTHWMPLPEPPGGNEQ